MNSVHAAVFMRKAHCASIAVGTLLIATCAAPGCGSKGSSGFGDDAGDISFGDDGGPGGPCENLGCRVVSCTGGGHTTISGTVFDPAGRNPLYNVYVYVPNAPVAPIRSGPVCTTCQAPASGSPLVGTQTDPAGHFTLTDVPVGADIPLVMQIGKFRRKITIANVSQCKDNPVGAKDANGLEQQTRLPRKQAEGDAADNLPQIAVGTGICDRLECLLRKIGIDDAEFTDPGGHVRLYQGNVFGPPSRPQTPSTAPYSTGAQDTLWSSASELAKYDVVMNSCECQPVSRAGAEQTVHDYVDGGGRLFGTHFHYNWFAPSDGPADFQSTAQWTAGPGSPSSLPVKGPLWIDTTFPKGKALDQWIQNVFASDPSKPQPGQIAVTGSRQDVAAVNTGTTRWIYRGDQSGPNYGTSYLSFNAPIQASSDKQCGRAVFSDLHVDEAGSNGKAFPGECDTRNDTSTLTQQEAALEFLFFDLSSCVSNDTRPPPAPTQ